jgi:predicted lipoprotein with Yx(FWY)xxD motif
MMVLGIALAATFVLPPDVPSDVQIIEESGRYVMRSNPSDKALYTYDRDRPDQSTCIAQCAAFWPPLRARSGARPVGRWTSIRRADGSAQWAFGGRPVYMFAHDPEGRATGDGTGGVWHALPTIPAR